MTPKEKAIDLIKKFTLYLGTDIKGNECFVNELEAKQCALITVDELLLLSLWTDSAIYDYWKEVKKEINKL